MNDATKIDSRYCYAFWHYSVRVPYVLVDVVLILHVSLMTKITVTLFTIISTYSPLAAEKSGGTIDRATTDSPYNEARCTGAWLYIDEASTTHTSNFQPIACDRWPPYVLLSDRSASSLRTVRFWPVLRTGYCREGPFLSGCVFWRLLSRPC